MWESVRASMHVCMFVSRACVQSRYVWFFFISSIFFGVYVIYVVGSKKYSVSFSRTDVTLFLHLSIRQIVNGEFGIKYTKMGQESSKIVY